MILKLLHRYPTVRISADEALKEPWIKKYCSKVRVSKRKATLCMKNLKLYKPLNEF